MLIEALVAALLMATALVTLAQLGSSAARINVGSRTTTRGVILAGQKLEQLRALAWGVDPSGTPISDFSTDTSSSVPSPGGTGLQTSPADALQRDTPGFVDYLDATGVAIRSGGAPPSGAVFVRRWSIESLTANQSVLIQVRVTTRSTGNSGDVRLATIKTRKGS